MSRGASCVLRDALAINMNSVSTSDQFDAKARALNIGAGLKFTVLGPRKKELDKLRRSGRRI